MNYYIEEVKKLASFCCFSRGYLKHRKEENKLEFAFQLAALRYQGWSYSLNKEISLEIIRYIAKQVGTVPKALKLYALRSNTSRDHIES